GVVAVTHRGEDRIRSGHPWIYKSDVSKTDARGGDTVRVVGTRGRVVGQALYSDRSEIALRLLTHETAPAGEARWRRPLLQAMRFRQALDIDATACRLVHGEPDLPPSLV